MLLDKGANPNAQLKGRLLQKMHTGGDPALAEGATPFMRAAKAGDVEVMRLLLGKGADPHADAEEPHDGADAGGGLRLSHAARAAPIRAPRLQIIEAIKLCLELGLDINAFNDAGLTPAAHGRGSRRPDHRVPGLAQGARMDIKDKQGRTPLDAALRGTSEEVRGSNVRETTAPLLRRLMAEAANRQGPAQR